MVLKAVLSLWCVLGLGTSIVAQDAAETSGPAESLAEQVDAAYQATIAREEGALQLATSAFDRALAHTDLDARDLELFLDAAETYRLAQLIDQAQQLQPSTLDFLASNDELRRSFVFQVLDQDNVNAAFSVLEQLRRHDPERVLNHPETSVALCVVHDQPEPMCMNENCVTPPSVTDVFDVYTSNRLSRSLRNMPIDLRVFVVDSVASIEELGWANQRHRAERNVGRLFHNIVYDMNHYRLGRPKRVSEIGYTLPNIAKYGGVCVDQAYYATQVAKSIGVPSVYIRASSGSGGHAWVGYLQTRGRKASWNFDEGRYTEYQEIRGLAQHPQTRESTDDAHIALQELAFSSTDRERMEGVAFAIGARRLGEIRAANGELSQEKGSLRTESVVDQLELLRAALERQPAEMRAWKQFMALADAGELDDRQLQAWASAVNSLVGRTRLDFSISVLMSMVEGVEESSRKRELLGKIHGMCRSRPDLAAEVLLETASAWLEEGNRGKAYDTLVLAAESSMTDGPFAIDALERAIGLLRGVDARQEALKLARRMWSRSEQPTSAMMFAAGSNWYRAGTIYARTLREAGRTSEAEVVERQLNPPEHAQAP